MEPSKRIQPDHPQTRIWFLFLWLVLFLILIAGCSLAATPPAPTASALYPSPSQTASPYMPQLNPSSATASPEKSPLSFATARIAPITPIPEAVTNLHIPADLRVLVLLGSNKPSPYVSHTDAIMLAFYNPRLAKVALLSLPPELFVYIPGYTMQRLNIAYAVGGFDMLADTIQYNFGIRPDEYALIHFDDFVWFIEELDGLDVDVFRDYYDVCGGIPAGSVHLRGSDVLCYVSFRDGWDIRDQAERQQQVVWKLFSRMVQGGKLVDLNNIYQTYKGVVESNLTLPELLANIPLALRLGQPDRFGYFQPGFEMFTTWDLPGDVKVTVLLPRGARLLQMVQQALDFTMLPVQSSDYILTLEYQMTISPTPTNTQTPSPTFTITPSSTPTVTISPTVTITPGGPTLTSSPTSAGYPPVNTVTSAPYP